MIGLFRFVIHTIRMARPIAILGAGNMASALALTLAHHKTTINVYCIEQDVEDDIRRTRCNTKYLPGHHFPLHVCFSNDLAMVLRQAKLVIIAVPSFAVVEVLKKAVPFLSKDAVLVSVAKGFDQETGQPLILREQTILPSHLKKRLVSLGGPAIATEMAQGSPTAFVAAGKDRESRLFVRKMLQYAHVKVSTSADLIGVSLASALKNPYAIALGMCDGLNYSTNAKSFVLTLALQEMGRAIVGLGGLLETAYGLAGLGDLLVTGFSPHGRNRTYGERLARAVSADPAQLGMTTVEGIHATITGLKLARQLHLSTPLLRTIHTCLKQKRDFTKPFERYIHSLKLV